MSESAYNSPMPLRRFTDSCCSSPARSVGGGHMSDALTDSDGEGDTLFVETPGPPEQTVISGWLKFRDNKKWKQRWGVITKLSPAAGIGYETALNFASRGCKVVIADVVDSSHSVKKIIETTGNKNITYRYLDLASFNSIRVFCTDLKRSELKIDILINNAGTIGYTKLTKDGFSNVLQVNYLGPFLLTHLLLDLLKKSKKARIVNISSAAAFFHWPSFPSINESQQTYNFLDVSASYSNSKLFCLIASKIFGEKLSDFGITCNAVHPGMVLTPMVLGLILQCKNFNKIFVYCAMIGQNFFKSIEEGAQTTLYCALDSEVEGISGKFFADCKAIMKPKAATDELYCQNLWKKTEELVGLADDETL